jgi:hypothetical protein
MKRLWAIGLTVAMCWRPIAAVAGPLAMDGPIGRTALAAVSRLPSPSQDRSDIARWNAAGHMMSPGDAVVIGTNAGSRVRRFVAVSGLTIVVLHDDFKLPERAQAQLFELARVGPNILVDPSTGGVRRYKAIQVSEAGISLDNVKVAELRDVVEVIPASEVQTISRVIRRGSGAAAAFGTVGGILVGSWLAGAVASQGCRGNCGGLEAAAFVAVIGVPTLTGYGAWRASSRQIEELLYHRP